MPINKDKCCQNCNHCAIRLKDSAVLQCEITNQEFSLFSDEASNNCCDQWEEVDLPF